MRNITRKEWIEALKSGKYQQGNCNLRSKTDKFCCLGVAATLAEVPHNLRDHTYFFTFPDYAFALDAWISPDFEKDLALSAKATNVLANKNDAGYTFEQIADLLIFDSWIRGIE